MYDILTFGMDLALGAAAFKLAWSVDRAQRKMVEIQLQQAEILKELTRRVERLEARGD